MTNVQPPFPKDFDFDSLRRRIEEASVAAFHEVAAQHPSERICSFALYSDDGGLTVCPSIDTRTALETRLRKIDRDLYFKYGTAAHCSMTLAEAIARIVDARGDAVIFARRPWSPDSESMIAALDHDLRIPTSIKDAGFDYVLEAPVVGEICEVFEGRPPTSDEKVRWVLYYAENDAFPEWVYSRPGG